MHIDHFWEIWQLKKSLETKNFSLFRELKKSFSLFLILLSKKQYEYEGQKNYNIFHSDFYNDFIAVCISFNPPPNDIILHLPESKT